MTGLRWGRFSKWHCSAHSTFPPTAPKCQRQFACQKVMAQSKNGQHLIIILVPPLTSSMATIPAKTHLAPPPHQTMPTPMTIQQCLAQQWRTTMMTILLIPMPWNSPVQDSNKKTNTSDFFFPILCKPIYIFKQRQLLCKYCFMFWIICTSNSPCGGSSFCMEGGIMKIL